jgi:prepilin signal peptidase PulO-like enzyme (type II secretory pathway)
MEILHFLISSLVISCLDVKTHRIRRNHVYLALVTTLPFITVNAVIFGLCNLFIYLVLFFCSQNQLGKGDLRLSPLMGIYLSVNHEELSAAIRMNLFTWLTAGVVILILLLFKRITVRNRIAFAPFMFLGVALETYI